MSKTILSEADGFTPVIDCVVGETSLMTAVVFGRIWRFCQMKDGVCNASLEKIAEDIGIDKATVMRHAKNLVDCGYLIDLTPDLRNHPHTYADTGKAGLKIGIIAGVAECNATVAECNTGVAQNQLKIDIKKDSKIESNRKKGDLVDGMLYYAEQAKLRGENTIEELLDDLERLLRRNIQRSGAWQDLAKWMLKRNESEPYKKWAEWYMGDPFQAKTSWRLTPDQVRACWPQAFVTPETVSAYRTL